jgi:hypothetical protein
MGILKINWSALIPAGIIGIGLFLHQNTLFASRMGKMERRIPVEDS